MENNNKERKNKSNLLTGLLAGIAGAAIGAVGAFVYNEISKDNQKRENNLSTQASNSYNSQNQVTSDWDEYESFLCPISQEVMYDPVITPKGISFERKAILNWLSKKKECPITKTPLNENDLISNYALKQAIENYFANQKRNNKN
jgi:hypothetical protein